MFVDGSNLVGSFRRMNVRIRFDAYEAFYQLVFDLAVDAWRGSFHAAQAPPAQLSRIYWYLLGSMDDWNLDDPKAQAYLKDQFENDRDTKRTYMALVAQKLPGADPGKLSAEAWTMCFNEFKDWYQAKQSFLEGIKRFHRSLRGATDFIDIVECGHWRVDLVHRSLTEKGIDTNLAVDMLSTIDNYDVAILVSNGVDAAPAINYVKRMGRHVGIVEFLKGSPPDRKNRQYSSKLNTTSDFVVQIYEMDLIKNRLTEDQNGPQEGGPYP